LLLTAAHTSQALSGDWMLILSMLAGLDSGRDPPRPQQTFRLPFRLAAHKLFLGLLEKRKRRPRATECSRDRKAAPGNDIG
jgi:hypothetical protein